MGTITRLFNCTAANGGKNIWIFFKGLRGSVHCVWRPLTELETESGMWWLAAGYWLGPLLLLHWRRAVNAFIFGPCRCCCRCRCLCYRWLRRQREIPKRNKRDMPSETPKGCLEVVADGVGQPTEPSALNSQIPKRKVSKIKLILGAFSGGWNLTDKL